MPLARTASLVLFFSISLRLEAAGGPDFQAESARATATLRCPNPKVTPGGSGFGALYGCVVGPAQTVKFFINEEEGTGRVKNAKLIWNDWFVEGGYGVHADKKEAVAFAKSVSQMYAPELGTELVSAFLGNAAAAFNTIEYSIAYNYRRGPKIDERMLVLTPQAVKNAAARSIQSAAGAFAACKAAVSRAVRYPSSLLSGDGESIDEGGYQSFMLKGRGGDLFFCEVYPGQRYKIKAALSGKFPFKYIAEGSL